MTTTALVPAGSGALPSLFTARPEARKRLRDFFSSHIRNRNTRRAYLEAVRQFAAFCAELEIIELAQVEAVHVAAFVERQLQTNSRPTVKVGNLSQQYRCTTFPVVPSRAIALRFDGQNLRTCIAASNKELA